MISYKSIKKILFLLSLVIFIFVSFLRIQNLKSENQSTSGEKIFRSTIIGVEKEEESQFENRAYTTQYLKIKIDSGDLKNREVVVQTGLQPKYKETVYKVSESILVGYLDTGIGGENFYVIGYSRIAPLFVLLLLFVGVSLIVARKKGLYSLIGMGVSITLLILFILPAIAQGANPLVTSVIGAGSLIPILFYISHGVNKKTTAAVIGTVVTFCITALIALLFVNWANLYGIFEEVETLLYIHDGNFDARGILLAGILLGILGVIDDVAITQASIVEELSRANKKMLRRELITKAMNVGRDHIGSVINTLILVYVGGSLTTILLFSKFPRPFEVWINSEEVAIPLVISLIGSLGLILAVPITTFISAWIVPKYTNEK
jgi:uncharacterized membrane protein